MSEDYRGMWKDMGLDLESHDTLLGVLGGRTFFCHGIHSR